jgi:hypothetical protein
MSDYRIHGATGDWEVVIGPACIHGANDDCGLLADLEGRPGFTIRRMACR